MVKAIVSRCLIRPPSNYASISGVKWGELPEGVRRACVRFLGYAGHPLHRTQAVEALALCYRQFSNTEAASLEPEMVAAMEKARTAIADAGSPAEQAQILLARAKRTGNIESSTKVARQLLEQLLAGTIPPHLREQAWEALWRNALVLTPESLNSLLDRVAAPGDDVQLRTSVVRILQQRPELYGRLFPIIADLVARGETFDVRHTMETIQSILERNPGADWADAAGALGYAVATCDLTKQCISQAREPAMRLYVSVVGRDAAEDIESMIQNAKLLPEIRAAAASQSIAASPDTKLLPALARNYDALPIEVRAALAPAVADAASVEGAPDLMARFFRDDDLLCQPPMQTALTQVKVPITPELRAALESLAGDPDCGEPAGRAIERCIASAREQQMKQQVKKWGKDAPAKIESMIQDDKLAPEIRAAAASQLIAASPETKLLPALTKNYDALPVEVRTALALAVADAATVEGASDFMARFFRDDALRGEQEFTAALKRLKLPLTPGLRDALGELTRQQEYNDLAWQALIRLR